MKRIFYYLCGFFWALNFLFSPAFAQNQGEGSLVVMELYTSQGCSSCPPADRLLGELARIEDVLALSFHVTYWDYLGWRDSFAAEANSERQRDYARRFQRRNVYTPQMIVAGKWQVVGSDKGQVLKALRDARKDRDQDSHISVEKTADDVLIRISGNRFRRQEDCCIIWLATYDQKRQVSIRRGENRGRQITYHNVVRSFHSLGMWRQEKHEITLMRQELSRDGQTHGAVIIQQGRTGPILAATSFALK